MNRHLKNTLRQNRVSYWDKITLGCLAVSYRRSGARGINICYRILPIKHGISEIKSIKTYRNITSYPVCDSFLFKATPLFGYN